MADTSTITTRLADGADAADIADLHVAAWRAAYRGIIDDEVLDSPRLHIARRDGWHRFLVDGHRGLDDSEQEIHVGLLGGRVCGFGHVGVEADPVMDADTPRFPTGGEVYGFYVHPDAWGTGVATAIMDECLAHLRRRFDHAVLWTFRDAGRARRFYERTGWSCGTGDDLVEDGWIGPAMPGAPAITDPIPEVQYRITLS